MTNDERDQALVAIASALLGIQAAMSRVVVLAMTVGAGDRLKTADAADQAVKEIDAMAASVETAVKLIAA